MPAQILATAKEAGRHESEGWRVHRDGERSGPRPPFTKFRTKAGAISASPRSPATSRNGSSAGRPAGKRTAVSRPGAGGDGLRHLHARPSGIVTNWNTGAERIKGYTAEEIVGQHISRFYSREDRAAGLPARGLETAAREGRYETEGWRVRKDGRRFWATVVIDAIHDPGGTDRFREDHPRHDRAAPGRNICVKASVSSGCW